MSPNGWDTLSELFHPNSGVDDVLTFGSSVAVSNDGTVLAVGMPGWESNTGKVFIFLYSNYGWSQWNEINGEKESAYFGRSMAISGDGTTLAVGAPAIAGYGDYQI